jgi:hypothetical protein
MSCSIDNTTVVEWTLDPNHVEEMYTYLYDNVEHGGEVLLDTTTKKSYKVVRSSKGKTDSVDAPDSIVNWHSHPINCYNNEKTVWGWPSGEDMRETLVYGLRGSACHIVPSVEGTYTMQPNPCIISGLINIDNTVNPDDYPELNKHKNWGNFLRGFIVATIEIYFRSTHVFRTTDYMKKYQDVSAHDFVDFANIFKLENIFSKQPIKGCSKLGCNQILKYENKRMSQIPFEKYVSEYEADAWVYYIDKNGESSKSKTKYLGLLNKGGKELIQNIMIGSNCAIPVKKWHTAHVFQIKLYNNKVFYNGKWSVYDRMNFDDKLGFLKGGHTEKDIVLDDRTIKFKLFDLKGNCTYNNIKSHMKHYEVKPHFCNSNKKKKKKRSYGRSKSKRKSRKSRKSKRKSRSYGKRKSKEKKILIIGSTQCSHCSDADKRAKNMKKTYKFDYEFREYPTIKEAIDEAQKINKKINSIPAFFLNNKYQENPPF